MIPACNYIKSKYFNKVQSEYYEISLFMKLFMPVQIQYRPEIRQTWHARK